MLVLGLGPIPDLDVMLAGGFCRIVQLLLEHRVDVEGGLPKGLGMARGTRQGGAQARAGACDTARVRCIRRARGKARARCIRRVTGNYKARARAYGYLKPGARSGVYVGSR